jgi:hypothetical protein
MRRGLEVVFLGDGRYGLWRAGEVACHLGADSPAATSADLFRLADGQVIALTNPWARGLVRWKDSRRAAACGNISPMRDKTIVSAPADSGSFIPANKPVYMVDEHGVTWRRAQAPVSDRPEERPF